MTELTTAEINEVKRVINSPDILKVALDTNVVLSYLNPKNEFHLEAKTAIDGLILKKAYFIIPYVVAGELIAHRNLLGTGTISIKNAISAFTKFQKLLKNQLTGGQVLNLESIFSFYQRHSRHRLLIASRFSDFIILCLAEEIKNVRILTCDRGMKKCAKPLYGNRIYFLPSKSKDVKSDYPRLMAELQSSFKI